MNSIYTSLPELKDIQQEIIRVRIVDINNNVIVLEMCKAYARTFAEELRLMTLERTV